MMLLASNGGFGLRLLVLLVAGWLVLRLVSGRRGERRFGGLKLLGLAAIVAGIAVFWIHPRPEVHIDYSRPVHATVVDHGVFAEHSGFGEGMVRVSHQTIRSDGVPKWVLISLGSGLVILGALLFGRGGDRPVVLKAVTLLGVGAIVYAVVTFAGQAPRHSARSTPVASYIHVEKRDSPQIASRENRTEKRYSHAKRPSLRPERSAKSASRSIEELPPRAGEIPVSVELERQASTAESKKPPTPEPAAKPTPASPPTPAPAPTPAAAPAQESKAEPAEPAAPPAAAEAAATAEPDEAAPTQPAPPEPTKEEPASPSEEPEEPTAKSEPPAQPKPVEPTADAEQPSESESSDEDAVADNEPRPDWVDALPGLTNGVYSTPVRSGRFVSLPECQRELDRQIKTEADHYVNEYLGEEAAALVDIPLSYLKQRVKKKEYVEVVHPAKLADLNLGHMYEIHARLEFDDQARADFRREWRNAEVVHRLWYTGGAAALVLALLGTLYGYLKLDLRTGGAHQGRLQLAATLVALIAAAGVLLVHWAVPF